MKPLHTTGWTEQAVQIIINKICQKLNIPELTIMPLSEERAIRENALGIYVGKKNGFYQALLLDEADMKTALHELVHHIQHCLDYDVDTPHDNTFTSASSRMVTTIRKLFGKDAFIANPSILRSMYSNNCESAWKFDKIKK